MIRRSRLWLGAALCAVLGCAGAQQVTTTDAVQFAVLGLQGACAAYQAHPEPRDRDVEVVCGAFARGAGDEPHSGDSGPATGLENAGPSVRPREGNGVRSVDGAGGK